ncbi:uncharacterized protein LOC105218465 isoform X1 [Zeugodacus cucurbitae]|uniref:uncharacterized protein LOC105218465 isoform X1 n=1 Tax=Zeugodacus cucurbitae TaxID=28588 RepID=UPI0023D93F5E|nr:uncharacterized protein LOC105218465 isoform X1 [Zeugodacus cucurbitae]
MDFDYVNLNRLSDAEIATHMRKLNYEKFKSLVRMHLSFELDLNTDEFDLPCHEIAYEDKGKLKKWNRLSKKQKHATSACTSSGSKGSVSAENSPVEALHQQINPGFLMHLKELKAFLMLEKNLTQEGIFRKTGSASRQNELRQQVQNDKPLDLEGGGYSAHDCATVFKGYLADLPEPLLTDAHYPAHQQIAPLCLGSGSCSSSSTGTLTRPHNPERIKREQHLLNSIQLLLLLLPDENRQLLQHIIEILHAVAAHEHENKMTPENLATIFAPHLICPRNLPPEALHYISKTMSSIIAYMVCKGQEIFEMPAKLSTDIRAYFVERKRKKTMSPEQTLDESISDMSTVNTVYTFVDREKTAAAHTANNTDTELAQLYAHIQSLPESSKKRRLIKQFNKQNGQGTPLQLVVMNRLKGTDASRSAKSIGDSIKKHIFHKSLISRTPKRPATTNVTTPAGIETPSYANTHKNPKMRVLFRSPASTQISNNYSVANTPIRSSSSTTTTTQSTHANNRTLTNTPTSSCTSSNTSLSTTPFAMKSLQQHPLHKSISSNSLLSHSSSVPQQRKLTLPHHISDEVSESSSLSSTSSDGLPPAPVPKYDCSVSAPVSRQNSDESNVAPSALNRFATRWDANCCTPLKFSTHAAKQLAAHTDCATPDARKTVAWDDAHLLHIEEISNPCTPIQQNSAEYKSRYKSEPNLSYVGEADGGAQESASKYASGSRSLTRKLMKGVSMGNLKFSFATPESTKRLVRTVSSTLRRRSAGDDELPKVGANAKEEQQTTVTAASESVEDLDDETFEDNPDDQLDSDSENESAEDDDVEEEEEEEDNYESAYTAVHDIGISTVDGRSSNSNSSDNSTTRYHKQLLLQQSGVYRSMELITSTPSLLLGRRSMSPITKSTQRMPKSMQESIMTPRSRKPVMVLTTTTHSAGDQNQTICPTDYSSLREQDEEESRHSRNSADFTETEIDEIAAAPHVQCEDATTLESYTELMRARQPVLTALKHDERSVEKVDALSSHFKEYLRSRSVLTASPVDSSFSSQPDDFCSPHNIEDLNDSQMSPSLLYCLDGHEPDDEVSTIDVVKPTKVKNDALHVQQTTTTAGSKCCTPHNSYYRNRLFALNNARKRAANSEYEKHTQTPVIAAAPAPSGSDIAPGSKNSTTASANKENLEQVDGYLRSRKLLISEYPGETSF